MACILTTSPSSMLQYPAIPPKRAECASLQFYGGFNLRHGSTYTLKHHHHHHHQHTSGRPFVAHSSLFPFFRRKKDRQTLKQELMEAIGPLDRGAEASPQDQLQIEKIVQDLEAVNPNRLPLQSPLLSGKWELLYTTSTSILKKQRPKLLRPGGPIFQAINTDTLRAQNLQTWPFFNQVTANLTPLNGKKVAVKFDAFKIGGLINVKAPDRARGELEITYLDEELRISRGNNGNLFVLRMVDPSYKVPL